MVHMSALKDRLRADLTTAIKGRDEIRSSTVRMLLSAITNAEVAGERRPELRHVAIADGSARECIGRRLRAMQLVVGGCDDADTRRLRSEEHTSELQSLMRIWYAV